MSDASGKPGLPKKVVRSVKPPYRFRPNQPMNLIGWAVFVAIAVVFFPILPFVIGAFVVVKLLDAIARRSA